MSARAITQAVLRPRALDLKTAISAAECTRRLRAHVDETAGLFDAAPVKGLVEANEATLFPQYGFSNGMAAILNLRWREVDGHTEIRGKMGMNKLAIVWIVLLLLVGVLGFLFMIGRQVAGLADGARSSADFLGELGFMAMWTGTLVLIVFVARVMSRNAEDSLVSFVTKTLDAYPAND